VFTFIIKFEPKGLYDVFDLYFISCVLLSSFLGLYFEIEK